MTKDELKKYLPREGDRVAVKAYALRSLSQTQSDASSTSHQSDAPSTSLDQRDTKTASRKTLLRSMMFTGGGNNDDDDDDVDDTEYEDDRKSYPPRKKSLLSTILENSKLSQQQRRKKNFGFACFEGKTKNSLNASKGDLAVDIGFSVYDKTAEKFKQVRSNRGGGIRHARLTKPVTKNDILETAKQSFFPDGESIHGPYSSFIFDVAGDVNGKIKFREDEDAEEFMSRLKMKKIRCYLLALQRDASDESDSTGELPEFQTTENQGFDTALNMSNDEALDTISQPILAATTTTESATVNEPIQIPLQDIGQDEHVTLPMAPISLGNLGMEIHSEVAWAAVSGVNVQLPIERPEQENLYLQTPISFERISTEPFRANAEQQGANGHATNDAEIPPEYLEEDVMARSASADSEIGFGALSAENKLNELDDTQPIEVTIKVHRGSVCRDFIDFFFGRTKSLSRCTTVPCCHGKVRWNTRSSRRRGWSPA